MLGGAAVDDIISHGDRPPPGGARRRLLVVAVLAVVLALVIIEHLPRGHHASQAGGNHVAGGGSGQRSTSVRLRAEGPAQLLPTGIIGRYASWAVGARVPRTGARPDWFWPAMGRFAPILGLPSDRFGYVFTRVDGGWAIQPDPAGSANCGDCARPPRPVFYLTDRAERATTVGSASRVAAGAARGQMWLTTYPPGANVGKTPGIAQQYNGAGVKVGAPVTLPAGYGITQGTRRGLLLVSLRLTDQGNTDRLWNPATGNVLRSFDGVLAVNAAAVAYAPPCAQTCPVRVFNVRSGRVVIVKMAPAETVTSGVFSPDGRFLALQVATGNGDLGDGGASAVQLEVARAATGRAVVVPHTSVSSDALVGFGWPGSHDDLVAEFSVDRTVQIALWDPAAAGDLSVADVRPAQDPRGIVVG